MNLSKILTLSLSSIFLLISCKKQKTELPTNNHIKFDQMAVGQKSQYVVWASENFEQESDTTFKQTTDTLTLTIYNEINGVFWVKEERNSNTLRSDYYSFSINNDTLKVARPSGVSISTPPPIIFQYGSYQYHLRDNNLPLWTTNRWGKPNNVVSNQKIGKVSSVKIMGKTYTDVFIYYNTELSQSTYPTVAVIYSKKDGFISFQYLGGGWHKGGVLHNLISK